MIIKITLPIEGYEGELYYQDFYFEGDKSPSKEEMKAYLEKENADLKMSEETYDDCIVLRNSSGQTMFEEILSYFDKIENWYYIGGSSLYSTNSFVEHPKFGKSVVDWTKITPFRL